MKSDKENYNILINVTYNFNDSYGLSYLTPERYRKIEDALSSLRNTKFLNGEEYHLLRKIFGFQYRNYIKVRYLDSIRPRIIAQKFIGKRKIREFIFKRDKYTCLCCGSTDNLSIDHINPVHCNGENRISNLQTLCKSCNSRKGSNFIDYR